MEVGRAVLRLSRVHRLLCPANHTIKRYSHSEINTVLWAWVSYHFINNWEMLFNASPLRMLNSVLNDR
ncbi:hypothetical protein TcWFU_010256 [Taenia crassiceps]|uniref:Uncharacterized protein n=1 Tax=Taenia crassiceps TaxID=6207 RepID=A0ABR4Q9S5_9CEST